MDPSKYSFLPKVVPVEGDMEAVETSPLLASPQTCHLQYAACLESSKGLGQKHCIVPDWEGSSCVGSSRHHLLHPLLVPRGDPSVLSGSGAGLPTHST